MTCAHCCDTNKFFDEKNAKKELKQYLKKGPTGATKSMLKALESIPKQGKSLLDIGGGIGVLQWEFLKEQADHVTDIDAATGYIDMIRSLAIEFDYQEKTTFIQGDFNDVADPLPQYDFVTLDKVICCYPDYELILNNALSKSEGYIALSYPISNVISKWLNNVIRLYFFIKKSAFKTYIHPSKKVERLIIKNNFKPIHKSIKFPWNIQVYKRMN
ncbi:MAG TPA: methyltransferase domain-containing protein [Fulvivirga sp.]|nr:methyltransferase domain-containing protein [Fulvivirga sp.]